MKDGREGWLASSGAKLSHSYMVDLKKIKKTKTKKNSNENKF